LLNEEIQHKNQESGSLVSKLEPTINLTVDNSSRKQTTDVKPKTLPLMSLMSPDIDRKVLKSNQLSLNIQSNAKKLEKIVKPLVPVRQNTKLEIIMLNRNKKRYAELKRAYKNDETVQEMLFDRIDLLTDMHMLMNYDFCNKLPKRNATRKSRSKSRSTNHLENQIEPRIRIEHEEGELDDENDENSQISLANQNKKETNNEKQGFKIKNQNLRDKNSQSVKQDKNREPNKREKSDLKESRSRSSRHRSRTRTRSRSSSRSRSNYHVRKRSRDRRSRSRSRSRSRGNSCKRSYLTQSSKYANNDNKHQRSEYNNRNNYNRRQDSNKRSRIN
jgi:hypothetical protein